MARFTGLSGEFTVRVLGMAGDGTVEVAHPGGARPFRARPRGPLGLLLRRPTGIRIVGTQNGDHHLAGTVADVAFRGRGYEHATDVGHYGRLTGVFGSVRAAHGEKVGLRLKPDGCRPTERAIPWIGVHFRVRTWITRACVK